MIKEQYGCSPLKQTVINSVYTHNWLSCIDDNTLATQLSIPGSHDSAAFNTPSMVQKLFTFFVWKTQSHDIQTQLNMGVRFFDVRVRCQQEQNISLCHGPVNLGQFSILIDPVVNFLKNTRSQFVVLMFQKEQGKESSQSSGAKILKQLKEATKNQIQIFQYDYKNKRVPRVGELRGKLWIIQAFPGNHNRVDLSGHLQVPTYCSNKILTDDLTYVIQNYWQGPQDVKKQAILQVMNNSKCLLRFNFVIQSNFPKYYSMKYNKWLKKILGDPHTKKLGILIVDFPDQELINAIIGTNF